MATSSRLILVTGANGYVASHVVRSFLEAGYKVRGTVRTEAAAEKVRKAHANHPDALSLVLVPDIVADGAFDEVVKDVNGIIHVASPYNLSGTDHENDLLIPAIKGTENILKSASAHAPKVDRIVITSSFAAIKNLREWNRPGYMYTESDFNPETYENAKNGDVATAYCAAKTLAEKAAWDYVDQVKPHYSISVLCPPKVFGPAIHDFPFPSSSLSSNEMDNFTNGSLDKVPPTIFWAWIDVRDLAELHLRAYQVPAAANERFLVAGGQYSFQQVCDILHASPMLSDTVKHNVPVGNPGEDYPGPHVYNVDNSKSIRLLDFSYMSLEDSVVDAAINITDLRAKHEAALKI